MLQGVNSENGQGMNIIKTIKNWALFFSMAFGAVVYEIFAHVGPLEPLGDAVGPKLLDILPVMIFIILYVTFCKVQVKEMRPHVWHFWLQLIRTLLSLALVLIILPVKDPEVKIIIEGIFICVICPTAAAAPVVTDKLGGSVESLTVYLLIANAVTSIIIPLFFPMVERASTITFGMAFLLILKRVVAVLVLPLLLALLTRRFLPRFADAIRKRKNLAFYIWCFNLSILMGFTIQSITHATISGVTLAALLILPAFIALLLFTIGKAVGKCYGDSVTAGQALGQKNNVVGIWLTINFLNPTCALAPCAYIIWQNLINAVQIRYKDKHGKLTW